MPSLVIFIRSVSTNWTQSKAFGGEALSSEEVGVGEIRKDGLRAVTDSSSSKDFWNCRPPIRVGEYCYYTNSSLRNRGLDRIRLWRLIDSANVGAYTELILVPR